jgi:hypothetical protein
MSKIKELTQNYVIFHEMDYLQIDFVETKMKEYAEWYLEQFKESCKDYSYTDDYGQTMITETQFNQIPNPPHE